MPVNAHADTLRAAVETVESAGGQVMNFVEFVLARRPVWLAQAAAAEFARQAASTAPLWRWVSVAGPQFVEAGYGTSMAATVASVTGLATTLGIPIVAAAGTWVMLGAGYYQARQEVRRAGFMSGFSHGVTTGGLHWNFGQVVRVLDERTVNRAKKHDQNQ